VFAEIEGTCNLSHESLTESAELRKKLIGGGMEASGYKSKGIRSTTRREVKLAQRILRHLAKWANG